MVYIIQSAILNQHLSSSKEKIYKNSKQKTVRLQLVYIQRNLQVCEFGLCHKQMHICPYKAQLPEPTLQSQSFTKSRKIAQLEPTKSFSFLPCLQRTETFIQHTKENRMIFITLR